MNPPTPRKSPPSQRVTSPQLDLFQWFLANDKKDVSNTIELWDCIPKYFFTPKLMDKLRTESGHADPYKWQFEFAGKACEVKIQPALIEQKDGSYKAFFPGVTEELVEEALKKVMTDQRYGLHEVEKRETWVRFTLKLVQKELKAQGKARSIPQVKHAIDVLSKSILSLYVGRKEIWSGTILSDLVTVTREDYEADYDAHHIGRLSFFISQAINKLEYRQFNYKRLMSCKEQLSRWIYRRLINRFKQASFNNSYHFMYAELSCSGLLQQSNDRENRKKVISALEELVRQQVLRGYESEPIKEGRRTIDVKYTLLPSVEFVGEQKASNKRQSLLIESASKKEAPEPVDKSL